MIACKECGQIKWEKVYDVFYPSYQQCYLFQCKNCKRVIATDSIEGEGSI